MTMLRDKGHSGVGNMPHRDNKRPASKGRRIGYVRINTLCGDLNRQLEGIRVDTVFTDMIRLKKQFLPQFGLMLSHLREGDTLLVQRIDRLGRSPAEFLKVVRDLTGRGVRIECITEGLVFPAGETSPLRNFLLLALRVYQDAVDDWLSEIKREARVQEPASGESDET
jgi:DNA invertase Pin-like site-specific DNA recombinase